jgi:MYXO-CTERM domain-containing protein
MRGYGYQWKISPGCCRAAQIEAGDIPPNCGAGGSSSDTWFWGLAAIALGLAVFLPAKGRRA